MHARQWANAVKEYTILRGWTMGGWSGTATSNRSQTPARLSHGGTPARKRLPLSLDALPRRHVRSSPRSRVAQIGLICAQPSVEIAKGAADQNGGSACGYQQSFALSASSEWCNVRVADPYIYAQVFSG